MKSLISAKHGHCGQRTMSDLMAKKAGCVTKRILWCPALGGVPPCSALCDISYNGLHPHRTDTVSPRSQGPELRCSPGLTGWCDARSASLVVGLPAQSLQGHAVQQNHRHRRESVNTDFFEEKSRQTTVVLEHLVYEQLLTGSLTSWAERSSNLVHLCHGRDEHELPSPVATLGTVGMKRNKACPCVPFYDGSPVGTSLLKKTFKPSSSRNTTRPTSEIQLLGCWDLSLSEVSQAIYQNMFSAQGLQYG